jgi:small subunit ribosomal protein S20
MPTTKSAIKWIKTSEKRRQSNKAVNSRTKSSQKKFLSSLEDKGAAEQSLKEYFSVLDKAVKKGVIKRNTAARRKSTAARKVAAI